MSIEQRRYEMPQPEKWLSEHEPWSTIALFLGAILVIVLAGILT